MEKGGITAEWTQLIIPKVITQEQATIIVDSEQALIEYANR